MFILFLILFTNKCFVQNIEYKNEFDRNLINNDTVIKVFNVSNEAEQHNDFYKKLSPKVNSNSIKIRNKRFVPLLAAIPLAASAVKGAVVTGTVVGTGLAAKGAIVTGTVIGTGLAAKGGIVTGTVVGTGLAAKAAKVGTGVVLAGIAVAALGIKHIEEKNKNKK
jgi:hypothetical protein